MIDYRYAVRYARLLQSMTVDQAKKVLGFPPGVFPSPAEVTKAFRAKAIQMHPDKGGTHEMQVDINVAKDVLLGNRREDRFPPVSWGGVGPKKDPETERREQEALKRREQEVRKRWDAIQRIAVAEKETVGALEPVRHELDIFSHRVHLPSFLTGEFADALYKIVDESDGQYAHVPDAMKAKQIAHILLGMSGRLAKEAGHLQQNHGQFVADLLGLDNGHLTFKTIAQLYADRRKFIAMWQNFAAECGTLMSLIRTSENVPVEWDDLYHNPQQVVLSFRDDFSKFSDRGLKRLEGTLKTAVQTVEGIVHEFGIKPHETWMSWKIPIDFTKMQEAVRATAS